MKKTLLILFISFFSFQGFAQDPDLFQTWYYLYQEGDLGDPGDFVWDIEPPITPYITITESLEFNGFGACNSFSGDFIYSNNTSGEYLNPINYTRTYETCDFEEHIDFEMFFLSFFANEGERNFSILDTPSDQYLSFTTTTGFIVHFRNSPSLSSSDNSLHNLVLYPNPVSDKLYISSDNTVAESTSIYSLTGKKILEAVNETNSINVSALSKGMYFLELTSSEGKTVKKFIKK